MTVKIEPNTGTIAVVYARYSSHNQGEQSIEGQLAAARQYAAAHGYTIAREYVDRAVSGRTDDRAEFQRMLKDTAKRQFSVIIVWKVDRFGRNREEIAINKSRCKQHGVRVEYVAEVIPDTPEGVILESVLEGFAEYYSLQLSQNIRRGIQKSAEKCQVTGGNRPLGYKIGPDKRLVIDEDTAPTVRTIFRMYADGYTPAQIAQHLNGLGLRTLQGKPFGKGSFHVMLHNEKYIGIYNDHGKHVAGGVPRIIDDETFYKVQAMAKINKRAPAKTWARADYILSDKLYCGECGAPMVGESGTGKSGRKHNYYICVAKKREKTCSKRAVRQADLEALVIRKTLELLDDDGLLEFIADRTFACYQAQEGDGEELAALRRQLEQTDTAIRNLIRAIEMGILTEETRERMDALQAMKSALKTSIAEHELVHGSKLTRDHILFYLHELRGGNTEDREVQRRLISTFVNAVYVYDDHLILTFNYTNASPVAASLDEISAAEDNGEGFVYYDHCSTNKNAPKRVHFYWWNEDAL